MTVSINKFCLTFHLFLLQVRISIIRVKIGLPEKHQELKNFLSEKGYKTLQQNFSTEEEYFEHKSFLNSVQLIKNSDVRI
jgi:hypothetical protein